MSASALSRETDFERIPPPTPPSVDEESSGYDRRFERKLTRVCSTPAPLSLVNGGQIMQIPFALLNIGADVAKDTIVVACSEGGFPVCEVANQRSAVLAFLKSLPAGCRIGVESTVTYHDLFAETAHQLGFLVFLLNPKDTRHYAKAVGLRGKTDRVDAELIARIDLRVKALVEADPERKQNFARLCTITGVGPVIGTALLNTLERRPMKSADAFVAFTGLDPRPDDSGQHRGKRRLSKRGPAELRRLLYMAAMSATNTKTWKPLYEHYRTKGLSSTATLVILARRIARTAWSIYTHKTQFDPARLTRSLT